MATTWGPLWTGNQKISKIPPNALTDMPVQHVCSVGRCHAEYMNLFVSSGRSAREETTVNTRSPGRGKR